MDQGTRTRLERNIFPAAQQACEPWETFPWHKGAPVPHSSQALAIDVFGTIKASAHCDRILDALAQTIGLPPGGPWTITLEWVARPTLFNETHPTQVDVYAESPWGIVMFVCKFTEQGESACSQTMKRNNPRPCNGHYVQQGNQENDMPYRCALTGKGIQYWEIIPKVFHLDAETDYEPCPFAGSVYQWMRHLVVAYKVARQKNKQPAVVIVYADHPDLSMAQMVESQAWTAFTKTVRQDQVSLHAWSYQDILALAQDVTRQCSGEQTVWKELDAWVNKKLSAIKKPSKKPKTRKFTHSGSILVS